MKAGIDANGKLTIKAETDIEHYALAKWWEDWQANKVCLQQCDMPEPEKIGLAISGLSTCLGYLKKLPDAMVAEMNDKQREIIVATLEEQAARYKTPNA